MFVCSLSGFGDIYNVWYKYDAIFYIFDWYFVLIPFLSSNSIYDFFFALFFSKLKKCVSAHFTWPNFCRRNFFYHKLILFHFCVSSIFTSLYSQFFLSSIKKMGELSIIFQKRPILLFYFHTLKMSWEITASHPLIKY